MTAAPIAGTILVTGASSGIGGELAKLLAPAATTLILVARRRDRLDELAETLRRGGAGLQVEVMTCDLGNLEDATALCDVIEQRWGGVDVLINNAGFGDHCFLERAEWPKVAQMIAVNVTALTLLCQRFVPGMVVRGRGAVLNVSSGFGRTYLPGYAAYVGTKHYVSGFTDALRAELAGTGVAVTQLCPGPVATEFHAVAHAQVGGASNPRALPAAVVISPRQCAEEALAGLRRNRAEVVPGWVFRGTTLSSRLTPRWVWRWITAGIARWKRSQGVAP